MVRDRLAVACRPGDRLQQPFADQAVEQLGVMEYIEVSAEVGVFVAEGVEAVRAGGDDFALCA